MLLAVPDRRHGVRWRAFWAPAMAMLSDAAEDGGLEQGFAAALINMAWAVGEIIGARGGGAIAKAAGDGAADGRWLAALAVPLTLVGMRGTGRACRVVAQVARG